MLPEAADERYWKDLGDAILNELRRLITAVLGIQEQIGTIRNQQEAANQQHQQEPPVLRAELQIPERIEKERKAQNDRQHCLQVWLTIGTWLAFIAASVYAGIAAFQLRQMKRAAHATEIGAYAAKSAATTAHDALVASQRPWVGISSNHPINVEKFEIIPNPVKPNGGEPTALRTTVSFWLENFGNSPARRIAPAAFGGIVTSQAEVPADWQKMECDLGEKISKGGTVPTFTIMPKSPMESRSEGQGGIPQNITIHHVWLLGCIVYQDTLGGPIHHTRIVLHSTYTPQAVPRFSLWDSDAD